MPAIGFNEIAALNAKSHNPLSGFQAQLSASSSHDVRDRYLVAYDLMRKIPSCVSSTSTLMNENSSRRSLWLDRTAVLQF